MAKNTSRRGASRGSSERQVPGWVWLFTGVVLGLFINFLYHLATLQADTSKPRVAATDTTEQQPASDDDEPVFDFYAVLPQMEVIVPKSEQDGGDERPSAGAGSLEHRHDEQYLLQAGSFRNAGDADKRRAALILQGYDVRVQGVKLDSGDTWHRVMVGPFDNANAMHRAQDKLVTAGIETLPIKVKKEG
jgi:cell division protein FtsN